MKRVVKIVVCLAMLCWAGVALAAATGQVPGTVKLLDFSFDAKVSGGGYLVGFTPPSDGKLVVTFENPDESADGNYHIYGRLPSDYFPTKLWDRMNLTGEPAPGVSTYFTPNLKGFKSTTIEFSVYASWGQTDIGCAYDPTGFSTGVDLTGMDRITVDFVPVTIESELSKARYLTSITSGPQEPNSVTTTLTAERPGRIIMHATSKGSGGGGHFVYLNDVAIGGIDTGEFNYSSPTYKTIPVRDPGTYTLVIAHADSVFGDNSGVRAVEVYFIPNEPTTDYVAIDIKPGSFPNSINPRNNGVIPVAVLTTDSFDAATVDATSVLFGAIGTEVGANHYALEDVNGDGKADLVFQFPTQNSGIACNTKTATLTGATTLGQAITGSDAIVTTGCK